MEDGLFIDGMFVSCLDSTASINRGLFLVAKSLVSVSIKDFEKTWGLFDFVKKNKEGSFVFHDTPL